MSHLVANLEAVRQEIDQAAIMAKRAPSSVQLIAVSKTHPAAAVIEAAAHQQTIFGESRVQEAREKIPNCPTGLSWHFIGHLQKNKIRQALPLFTLFHSIDSEALAGGISRIAGEMGRDAEGLLEVNVSGEPTKHGFTPEDLSANFSTLIRLPPLRVRGLMTMAPYGDNPEEARPFFRALRQLRDELQSTHGVELPELSMGMSGDFRPAIGEGATLVRVGTSIFGDRPQPQP